MPTARRGARAVPRTVWLLGLAGLFAELGMSLVYSLMPLLLVNHLGASVLAVGIADGIAEGIGASGRVLSGALSDWVARRKSLVVLGYGLNLLAKLLFAPAASVGIVVAARSLDRLGKGVRSAPRDALVGDVTAPGLRGAAFGIRQTLDEVGSLLGPLVAAVLMLLLAGDLRLVLWLACIPAGISVAVMALGVREPEAPRRPLRPAWPLRLRELRRLGRPFWLLMAALSIVLLTRFSDAFYLLRGQTLGLGDAEVPLLLATTSVVSMVLTAPFGRWSDSIGRRIPLLAGIAALALAHAAFALAGSPLLVFVGTALYGLHFALLQPAALALILDLTPPDRRGTAFGVLYLTSGLADLTGSIGAGWMWEAAGPGAMFAAATAVACAGLIATLLLPKLT